MNSSNASAPAKRVLMIVANPAISPVTGWPIGFWAAELTHPWLEFAKAGYAVELASPAGGKTVVDGYSDPRDASGNSANDIISMGALSTPAMAAMLEKTKALADVKVADYDAIFARGGQSPMVTFFENAALHAFVAAAYEAGKITALARHGTCASPKVRTSDGKLLVEGRRGPALRTARSVSRSRRWGARSSRFRIETEAEENRRDEFHHAQRV